MRILLLSRYGSLGASSRIRCYQYLPFLERQEIDVTVCPLFDNGYLEELYAGRGRRPVTLLRSYLRRLADLCRGRRYDLVWLEKELFAWLPAWAETILARAVPYVVDYDDATFHGYDRHPNRAVAALLGGKIDAVMRRASLVTAGNGYLADRARRAGARRVEILPSVVDLDRYAPSAEPADEVFTIGWIGSPSTARHVREAGSALAEVCAGGGTRVVLVGAGANPVPGLPAVVRSWSEETEVEEVRAFHVGIMPLPDETWERGKCGYKLIQYMACGRPVVGSPVGANREIIVDGINGWRAAGHDEWVDALTRLRTDASLRRVMGANGRRMVEDRYSLQVTAPRLYELLRSAAAGA